MRRRWEWGRIESARFYESISIATCVEGIGALGLIRVPMAACDDASACSDFPGMKGKPSVFTMSVLLKRHT